MEMALERQMFGLGDDSARALLACNARNPEKDSTTHFNGFSSLSVGCWRLPDPFPSSNMLRLSSTESSCESESRKCAECCSDTSERLLKPSIPASYSKGYTEPSGECPIATSAVQ